MDSREELEHLRLNEGYFHKRWQEAGELEAKAEIEHIAAKIAS